MTSSSTERKLTGRAVLIMLLAFFGLVIGVNLLSAVWGIEIFGPLIERQGPGGHIVSTASIAGLGAATNPA